ncbi:MAG TPA: hypothetical protein VFB38_17025 [Chthonomonadaceae bacterium]|nr:hypothetical protein [Chthonomonadaceae bacterium]
METLHFSASALDVTQPIPWPASGAPRVRATQGGLRRDTRLLRLIAGELALVVLLIAAMLRWSPAPSRIMAVRSVPTPQPSSARAEKSLTAAPAESLPPAPQVRYLLPAPAPVAAAPSATPATWQPTPTPLYVWPAAPLPPDPPTFGLRR